ncbi:hypothetical protein [Kribbella solani]|uniref:Uncharacterized protein n=1 Tax=Kribbella solani TaxID=236067 RepID=A0A841E130_9ACTN|nr:hypothetical protein [Kribbella solani]MBB5981118.1 hypothetical protein [Kribbella solani]
MQLTDEEIAAMTPDERRELIQRLAPRPHGLPSARTIQRLRKWRSIVLLLCAVALIPWTVYLAATLPYHYVARNWGGTWVGFDLLLVTMLLLTAWAGWRRKQYVFPTGFATGVLLVCDAWFDVMTSQHGSDLLQAMLSAVLIELPLAFILIAGPLRLLRFVAIRHGMIHADSHLWRMPIPIPDLYPDNKVPLSR